MKSMGRGAKAICFILLITLFSSAAAQTAHDPIEPITSALRNHQFDQALQLLQRALQQFPKNAQLWTLQGIALSGQGRNQDALAAFHRALSISPDLLPALEGAAQIEYAASSKDAIPLLHHLLRLHPNDPTSHAMLAVLEYQRGNCEAAVAHFDKAGTLLDSQIDALHAYATCLVKRKQFDQATEIFQHAVALRPDDPQERHLLASIQLLAKKPKDALATLDPLLQSASPAAETLELVSAAYEDSGDTPQAVRTLREAIVAAPTNVSLYLDFATISFAHQSFQVGIDILNDGLGLMPTASQLFLARGVLYVQLAQYDKAQDDFERAYQLDPSQSLSSAAQGLAAVQEHDLDRALTTVHSKLARNPNDPILLYLQADILSEKGVDPGTPDFQRALRSAKKAVALRPSMAPAHDTLAKLYLLAGDNPAAAEQSRKALAHDPKDQTAVYHLIQALRKTGQKAEIPDLLKRLAELRAATTQEEREHNRYRLVEDNPSSPETSHP
ncbi:MAG TPA: tetratricopeptide repeat protein [Terriglobales bacterium]|jgi:tetratricopeptide (TPR) repeat protein|nr:tetratricopeptide repeat protein [Terriglobales bacterium]